MSGRRSRTSLIGLLARQFRSDLGPLLAMAAIVLVVATLAATAPLAVRAMTTAEVAYQFENLPAPRRDLLARVPGGPEITPGSAPFAKFDRALAAVGANAPTPLRKTLGRAEYSVATDSLPVLRRGIAIRQNDPLTPITINVAPALPDHIRMVEGALPAPFKTVIDPTNTTYPFRQFTPFERNPNDPQIDIVLSAATAKQAGWVLGEERWVSWSKDFGFYARLSGTFEAHDPKDGFWAASRSTLSPEISSTGFGGTRIVTGAAYIDPGSWKVLLDETGLPVVTSAAIPFSGAGLTVEEDQALLPQLRSFTSQPQPVATVTSPASAGSLTFRSDADSVLTTALTRAATASVVLVMVASGPIGVAVAGLWLLSRLVILRRREALALMSARGASEWQLRSSQALEALLLSVPAAAVGAVVGYALFPSSWSPVSVVLAAAVAATPPILIAIATTPQSLRGLRGDLDPRTRGRYRWTLEVSVLAIAALAVFLLLQRGLTSSTTVVGIDPLLAATPLLLCFATGLVVLRLYPLPLIGYARMVKSRKGIVAFLGANRALRDPAAGLAPVLAMVVGLAVAIFSGVLLATVGTGIDTAAKSAVGASMRLDSPGLGEKQLSEIAAINGVEESVGLYQYNRLLNLSVQENLSVPVIVVDTAALARVQEGVPGSAHVTLDMSTVIGGSIPVLLSPDLASHYSIGSESTLNGTHIVSAGDPGTSTSLSGVADWVLVDAANSHELGIETFLPRITLLRLATGADATAVSAELARIVGPDAIVTTSADVANTLKASPVADGIRLALLALIAIVALLCAAAVVLALTINGPARERLLGLLRTLGITRAQARGITGWEIGPTAAVAIVTGCLLGVILPLIVLSGVDLRPFTGGSLQPNISVDPALLGMVIGGFAAIVLVATLTAMAAARRVSLAKVLRTSEEG